MPFLRFSCTVCASLTFCFLVPHPSRAEDPLTRVRKAVAESTLDQKGTHPFHLAASLAPSMERDSASGRTGTIEIWWRAPGEMRREIRTAGFHQVQIVSQGKTWEKDEGDY